MRFTRSRLTCQYQAAASLGMCIELLNEVTDGGGSVNLGRRIGGE